jgi:hypothetical protein
MTDPGARPPDARAESTPPVDAGGDRVTRLATYFRENRDRFTSETLKRSAAEAGYEPAEIELAWSKIAWGDPERAVGRAVQPAVTVAVAIVYLLGAWIGVIGLASNQRTDDFAGPGLVAALVGGLLAWAALREQSPSAARGIAIGMVLVVTLRVVLLLVVLGACLAMGYNPLS